MSIGKCWTIASRLLSMGFDGVRRLLWHANPIRVPLVIVLAAVLLTRGVAQIHELFSVSVAAVEGGQSPYELARILVASLVLSGCVWYSARIVLRFDVVRSPSGFAHANMLFRAWTPRVLAFAITAIVALGFVNARGAPNTRALCAMAVAGSGAIVFAATWLRRSLCRRFRDDVASVEAEMYPIGRWPAATRAFSIASIVVFAFVNACAWMFPRLTGAAAGLLGPLSTLMLLAALFIVATTPLVLWSRRWQVPVFVLLLTWATCWQIAGAIDNHEIGVVAGTPSVEIETAFGQWLRTTSCKRAYFVSAEGGGIRAAAWTALALARINRRLLSSGERLSDCLVAASGVSGGSLGLAAFVAGQRVLDARRLRRLAANPSHCETTAATRPDGSELECRLVYMLTRDFMSPTLAAMFTSDQLQRLLPHMELPDRGGALEDGFSRAFADAFNVQPDDAMGNPFAPQFPFSRLYPPAPSNIPHPWVPVLVLNTTEVRTGARVLQSGLDLSKDSKAFPAAAMLDQWLHGVQTTLVGAVHNSARFTYISPAGSLPKTGGKVRQLVDGGYFENSGATTLLDLLRLFHRSNASSGWTGQIVAIHISNDPDLVVDQTMPDCQATEPARDAGVSSGSIREPCEHAYGEIVPPLLALFNTRESRAEYARRMLEYSMDETAGKHSPLYVHLGIRHVAYPLPLGWRIGNLAVCELIRQFDAQGGLDAAGIPAGGALRQVESEQCDAGRPSTFIH